MELSRKNLYAIRGAQTVRYLTRFLFHKNWICKQIQVKSKILPPLSEKGATVWLYINFKIFKKKKTPDDRHLDFYTQVYKFTQTQIIEHCELIYHYQYTLKWVLTTDHPPNHFVIWSSLLKFSKKILRGWVAKKSFGFFHFFS